MADDEKDITIKFIEDYRSFPLLWDPKNKLYTNKIKRNDALQDLAEKYNMDIDGVKKKIKSLRSYFSKELKKVNKKKSGAGTDELYHSPWFAYKHLLFIADSVTPRETRQSSTEEEKEVLAEISNNGESCASSHSTFMSEDEHEFALPPIRRKKNIKSAKFDYKEEKPYQFMKKSSKELSNKDEFTIYGQLIAHKIQNLNSFNRLIAQQRINNILFELEMKQLTGVATQNVTETMNLSEMQDVAEIRAHPNAK